MNGWNIHIGFYGIKNEYPISHLFNYGKIGFSRLNYWNLLMAFDINLTLIDNSIEKSRKNTYKKGLKYRPLTKNGLEIVCENSLFFIA